MKKLISLLLIVIVFSINCYSVSASVFPFEFDDDFLESEEVEFPCYTNLDIFVFDENSFNQELSQGVASVEYTESGTAIIVPDSNVETIKVYFNISNECYAKMGKAFRAIKGNDEQYNCYLRSGRFIPDKDYSYYNYNGFISLLDEQFNIVSQARSNGTCKLKPAISRYLCLQIDNSDVDKEEKGHSIFITKLKFERRIIDDCEIIEERKEASCTDGYVAEVCKVCGCCYSHRVLPGTDDHKPIEVPEVPATCSQTGCTAHSVCGVCGMQLSVRFIIPKLAHTPSNEWVVTKSATVDSEGEQVKKCSVCSEVIETKIIPKLEPTTPPVTEPITQPSTQPTVKPVEPTVPSVCVHTTVIENFKQSTFFAKGYTGNKVCSVCGETIEEGKAIAKLTLKVPKFKLTKDKKHFKVKYTKVAGATGFQIRYKLKGKWKTKTFNTKKTATKLIKKLKKGKFQVQIRAMITQGKQKAYSSWSKTQKVKVK